MQREQAVRPRRLGEGRQESDQCGKQIIGDVKPVGGGKWDNGWIYDPDAGSKYDVELTPVGDKLKVVGYAGTKWLSETYDLEARAGRPQEVRQGRARPRPRHRPRSPRRTPPGRRRPKDAEGCFHRPVPLPRRLRPPKPRRQPR